MEEANAPAPQPAAPSPTVPNPVMDVVARPKPALGSNASPEPMAIAPPEEGGSKAQQPLQQDAQASPKDNTPKQRGNSVTPAIFATVIIVFGLALMAVYAYLHQK